MNILVSLIWNNLASFVCIPLKEVCSQNLHSVVCLYIFFYFFLISSMTCYSYIYLTLVVHMLGTLIFSLSVLKKKLSYCDCLTVVVIITVVVIMQKLSPLLKKYLVISTPDLEYLLIRTRCSCMTRDLTLKTIVLELFPFLI